ncbi:CYTH and CHAD domain-containing protein [Nonomuraea sp. NBC_01738]|uniref:CYTH and CHAD domain-containing protein n=1 Tax=Nonomuraea sp. NBC_01738 TaxID=2976003 RepID=UPI002E0FF009|nr:CYTH and CHAD domain-containing protein [Nonomuraea sp. NBC_01738]
MGIEIEDKFDVPSDYAVPNLAKLGDVIGPKGYRLVALYFDTADLRLAVHGVTLRRRRGGADAGWHLKLPKAKGVRQEITHPLTRSTKIVPAELEELVRAYTRGAALQPVAELATRREVTVVADGDIGLIEVADDRVKGTVFQDGKVERWREVEAEILGGDEELLAKVGKRLRKAGATPSPASSKLGRLLQPAELPRTATEEGTAGEVVVAYLNGQVRALLAQDPRVRRAEEDAVHQMRVAARRMRSALKAFRSIVPGTEAMQEELRWLGVVLGEARDLEVIRARFAGHLAELPPELVAGPIRARLGDGLAAREHEVHGRIKEALSGERYYALLDALEQPFDLGEPAAKPAEKTLADVAAKNWRRVTRAYDAAQAIDDGERREIAMHDVRKAAKRARYTAEALGMHPLATHAEAVQEALGLYRDGVVAQETLAKEAEAARQAGEDTFTYGVLIGLEKSAAERAHAEFPRVWTETVKAVARYVG